MRVAYKGTDKEGRIRLGSQFANKQWQMTELDSGEVFLTPMIPVTDHEAMDSFQKMLKKHKKTIDALK
jgi:hypothetical protein